MDWQYRANKSYCEDLTEGKFSFPIIHAIRADFSDTSLLSILFICFDLALFCLLVIIIVCHALWYTLQLIHTAQR